MRWIIVSVSGLLLAACNEVAGDTRGGMIDGSPITHNWVTDQIKEYGFEVIFNEDAIQKANAHCGQYGKSARITSVAFGKTLFECL
jgi:hypothetical protein